MKVDNGTIQSIFEDVSNIIATCILIYNLCIVNNEGIEDELIVKI